MTSGESSRAGAATPRDATTTAATFPISYMGKKIKIRRTGNSLVMTVPSSVAELFGPEEEIVVEIEAMGTDSFRVQCRQ